MHKYNLAAFYFRQALQENNKALSLLPPVEKSMFVFFIIHDNVWFM